MAKLRAIAWWAAAVAGIIILGLAYFMLRGGQAETPFPTPSASIEPTPTAESTTEPTNEPTAAPTLALTEPPADSLEVPFCGDGNCDSDERCDTCPDCGCLPDEYCVEANGVCYPDP
ncbi:MAG: hypothetical protein V1787_01460 [Candidatus Micrarchaeota archaeon]